MSTSDDWIHAFAAASLQPSAGSSSVGDSSPGLTVLSSPSGSLGEYVGGAKRAHLFLFDPALRLCFGFVGAGEKRFCLKTCVAEDGRTCGVAKHTRKFTPSEDVFYLRGNDTTAFCLPSFPRSLVPPDYVDQVLSTQKTIDEWRAVFTAWEQEATFSSILPEALDTEIKMGGNVKVILKTPMKRNTEASAVPTGPNLVPRALAAIVEQEEILPMDQHWWDDDDDASLLPSSLFTFLRDLRSFLLKYDQWLLEPNDIIMSKLTLVEEDLLQIHHACEKTAENLGKSVSLLGMDFPDVWCALEYLGTHFQEQLSGDALQVDLDSIQMALRRLSHEVEKLTMLPQQVQAVQELVKKHSSRFDFIQPILMTFQANAQVLAELPEKLAGWDARLSKVEHLRTSPSRSTLACPINNDPWTKSFAPMPDQMDVSQSNIGDAARLTTLEHAVQNLEKRIVGEGTKIGRFLFQSR